MARPSQTAVSVARALLHLDRSPKTAGLLPPGAAETTRRLLGTLGRSTAVAERLLSVRILRGAARSIEARIMPGFALHLGLRKRFFDDEVRALLARGMPQVIVLGAGFDSLAARLAPQFPRVSFFELDQDPMSALKERALRKLDLCRDNLHLVPLRLGDASFAATLASCASWRPDAPSCVLAEGLLMYLDAPAAASVLEAAGRFPSGSRLIFSFVSSRADGYLELGCCSGLKRLGFSLLGESLRWGIPKGQLDAELASHGLQRCGEPEDNDLRARYLAPAGLTRLPLAMVEGVCVAEPTQH